MRTPTSRDCSGDKKTLIIVGNSSFFRRGEGVNVFSENSYRLRIYLDALDVFLQHQLEYKLDLHLNIGNILQFGQSLLEMEKEERAVFRVTRSKKVFEIVTSFEALIHLVSKFSITKNSVNQSEKEIFENLASSLKVLSLWRLMKC